MSPEVYSSSPSRELYMWQSLVEMNVIPFAYFDHIAMFETYHWISDKSGAHSYAMHICYSNYASHMSPKLLEMA